LEATGAEEEEPELTVIVAVALLDPPGPVTVSVAV
jgi:hypothetical protein